MTWQERFDMNLKEIIARKKWDFDQEYFDSNLGFVSMHDRDADGVKDFLEKAIRESVEEALQDHCVRNQES